MSLEELTDGQLLDAYADEGSERAFGELVRRYIGVVYGAARRQVKDAQAAEDVTQAVFIVLARKGRELRRDVVLGGWLHGATRLAALDWLKIESRRRRHEREAASMRAESHADPQKESGGESEMLAMLDEGLAKLGERDRAALVMRFFQNQSMKEVGAALGASENTASTRVGRALEKLRDYFARKGVAVPASAVAALLTSEAARGVPAGLAETMAKVAGASGTGPGVAGSAAGELLAKGVVAAMTAAKAKVVAIAIVGSILVATTVFLVSNELGGGPGDTQKVQRVEMNVGSGQGAERGNALAAKGPRKLFSTIRAASYDEKFNVTDYGPILGSMVKGSWLRYNSVDFGAGATTFGALIAVPATLAGRTLEIRLDSLGGQLVGVLQIKGTAGWTDFVWQETQLTGATGVHDVYLVVGDGQHVGNLTSFKFTRKFDATELIPATSFKASHGAPSEKIVVLKGPEDWVSYGPIDFGSGVKSVLLEVSAPTSCTVEIRLDGVEQAPVATVKVGAAGVKNQFSARVAEMGVANGPHDVFIRLGSGVGPVTIRSLQFNR
jgi:RNA polymerase sigma factor (sigma-70 family)